ncbi:PTS fructose transporter subunit IIABC [Mycetocola reblochoni]|uniref:PTS system, fructose-specific IIA component / PTS system, fructose-specific IIB component / PTS system, fructose-specific IIC component n=2 Tax=Mycetocola reblochoni TaxID=331618 RepID=A0A1R4IV69_9MICO|nr:fructose-specific PTS transporter subunit EIIC [Mycetocola reblochoni]RLP71027.1 PTS lactose transporter subunit IIC [Mycetocola reblochoni]SJN23475.1 PTS system, fructose-specific IIA component / PTS system, fructose-specific IIB component / PTS system, fructose-specific IIC component [Mycetocola reblochoni REB411]
MQDIITSALVSLDTRIGADKPSVIRALAQRVVDAGRATGADALFDDAWAREQKDATGLPGGIAIPHCRSAAVTTPSIAMARLAPGVDFGAADGPADLVFFLAAPAGADSEHLSMLSSLARALVRPDFTAALRAARSDDEVVALVAEALGSGAPAAHAPAASTSTPQAATGAGGRKPRIVAVTACATGIAHTFMAADALTAAGQGSDVELHVEPQGSSGYTPLPASVIADADAVIFAVDVDVRGPERFAGKPVIRTGVKRGIEAPGELIAAAVAAIDDPRAEHVPSGGGATAGGQAQQAQSESVGARIKRWLLTGVSYMIPFVAGGGLLIALGFLLGGFDVTDQAEQVALNNSLWELPAGGIGQYLGSIAFIIGKASMDFLVPVLAGFIAFAIADRPGIAPGFVAGSVSVLMGAGFIGGLVGGLLAGFIAWAIGRINAPRWLRGLMPVVIIPLIGSIVTSGLLLLVLGRPIAWLMSELTAWLTSLSGAGAIALGALLGLMMCFDLGGPINKVAYTFATTGLAAASMDNPAPYTIMAAVMAAGMVPPIAMSFATWIAPKRFTAVERQNGASSWLLGAAFISEGAIPFAAVDPLRVLPAAIAGGTVTGALSMALGVQSLAPHGGVFVFFAINPFLGFAAAVLAGVVISTAVVIALKFIGRPAGLDAAGAQPAEAPGARTAAAV